MIGNMAYVKHLDFSQNFLQHIRIQGIVTPNWTDQWVPFSLAHDNCFFIIFCRNLTSLRTNMSLPVSPCSSPLRQFRQSNRSCLPSPPHPSYSSGADNYSPVNNILYPARLSNNISNPFSDIGLLKARTPSDSSRRLNLRL